MKKYFKSIHNSMVNNTLKQRELKVVFSPLLQHKIILSNKVQMKNDFYQNQFYEK